MQTRMTDEDWEIALEVFHTVGSQRSAKGRHDFKFLEDLYYFALENVNWQALPSE